MPLTSRLIGCHLRQTHKAILSVMIDTPDPKSKTIWPLCTTVSLTTSTMALGSNPLSNDRVELDGQWEVAMLD